MLDTIKENHYFCLLDKCFCFCFWFPYYFFWASRECNQVWNAARTKGDYSSSQSLWDQLSLLDLCLLTCFIFSLFLLLEQILFCLKTQSKIALSIWSPRFTCSREVEELEYLRTISAFYRGKITDWASLGFMHF